MAPRGRIARAYKRWNDFELISLFQRAPPPKTPRTIFVGEDLPEEYYNVKKNGKKTIKPDHVYNTNQVVTSKYTIVTFLPRNLLEQFRRVANMLVPILDFNLTPLPSLVVENMLILDFIASSWLSISSSSSPSSLQFLRV